MQTELRVQVQNEELSVLDGYCNATGKPRTEVIRALLKEWSDRKLHEATLICRVAGCNPTSLDKDRNVSADIDRGDL